MTVPCPRRGVGCRAAVVSLGSGSLIVSRAGSSRSPRSTVPVGSVASGGVAGRVVVGARRLGSASRRRCRRPARLGRSTRSGASSVLVAAAAASAASSAGGSPSPASAWSGVGFVRRHLADDGVLGRRLLGRHRLDVDDARPRLDHAGEQREVLAQREALELRRQVHVAQVGVAGEPDAEHLVGLPLVPVGAGVDGEPRLDGERVVGDVDLERHADVAADVGHAGEHLEPRRRRR